MKETKQCPYCGEEILAVAKKCKHCGEWLEPKEPEKEKKMIECPVCGEDVEEETDICPYCHERIEGADEAIQEPKEHKVRQAQPSERQEQPQTTTEILTVSDTESKEDYGEEEEETDGLFQYYFTDVFFRHYADFKGKLSRKRFWMAYLFLLLTMMPVYCLDFALFGVPMVFYYIYTLALLVPSIAFAVRRLHDTGKSGWNLLWSLIPLVGVIIVIVMLCKKGEKATAKPHAKTKDYVLFGAIGVATAVLMAIGFATLDNKADAAQNFFETSSNGNEATPEGSIFVAEAESGDAKYYLDKEKMILYQKRPNSSSFISTNIQEAMRYDCFINGIGEYTVLNNNIFFISDSGGLGSFAGYNAYYFDMTDETWNYIDFARDMSFDSSKTLIHATYQTLVKEGSCVAENVYDYKKRTIDLSRF